MKASFTANIGPGAPVISWNATDGFTGSIFDIEMNHALYLRPGQTHTPPAILARDVLLEFFPSAQISDFINPPLEELEPGEVS